MNILSAALSLIAVILEFIILFSVKDLQLYGIEAISEIPAVEMQPMSSNIEEADGIFFKFISIFSFGINQC